MFYVPFKLRETAQLKTPKGPRFSKAARICVEIAGTELNFRAPKHRPEFRGSPPVYPERHYTNGRLPIRSYFTEEDAARGRKDNWRYGTLFYHSWAFCGPWFTGVVSELRFRILLIRPVNYVQKFSLFHPRALEMVIGDYLDYRYAHRTDLSGQQQFMAPVNWQPLNSLSVNAVRMEVVPCLPSAPTGSTENFVFFPLADDLMALCRFEPSRFLNLPKEEIDKLVDLQPMLDLMNEIIDSIQIKLSPEAQEQQAKALEGLVDTSLVKEFPPLKWGKFDESSKTENLTKL